MLVEGVRLILYVNQPYVDVFCFLIAEIGLNGHAKAVMGQLVAELQNISFKVRDDSNWVKDVTSKR